MYLLRIFFLHLQKVFEQRTRSFIWFLLPVMNASIYVLFWHGAAKTNQHIGNNWDVVSLTTYYILFIIAGALNSHVEERVAEYDIAKGELVNYLLKPFPYFLFKFFDEMPYRLLQSTYAIIVFLFCLVFLHLVSLPIPNILSIVEYICMILCAVFIMFIFKMIIGFAAFFSTEIYELRDIVEILQFIFAGFILPLDLFPSWLYHIALSLPFAYASYFPVLAVEGKLSQLTTLQVIEAQIFWIVFLSSVYFVVWKVGLRRYTGFGQ